MRNFDCEAECFTDPACHTVLKETCMCYIHISKGFDDGGHMIKMKIVYEEIK